MLLTAISLKSLNYLFLCIIITLYWIIMHYYYIISRLWY
jgi:hypothetical protein